MGYLATTIKAPKPNTHTGWFRVKAGYPCPGCDNPKCSGQHKAAFFGDIKEHTIRRAEEWLLDHQPVIQISVEARPTLSIVRSQ